MQVRGRGELGRGNEDKRLVTFSPVSVVSISRFMMLMHRLLALTSLPITALRTLGARPTPASGPPFTEVRSTRPSAF